MESTMSPTRVAFALENDAFTPASQTDLSGRWRCSVTESTDVGGTRRIAAGTLDLVHAGTYFVGSARSDGDPASRDVKERGAPGSVTALEGPVFGAVTGRDVVLWVTEVFGGAMWVMQGQVTDDGILGTVAFTEAPPLSQGRAGSLLAPVRRAASVARGREGP